VTAPTLSGVLPPRIRYLERLYHLDSLNSPYSRRTQDTQLEGPHRWSHGEHYTLLVSLRSGRQRIAEIEPPLRALVRDVYVTMPLEKRAVLLPHSIPLKIRMPRSCGHTANARFCAQLGSRVGYKAAGLLASSPVRLWIWIPVLAYSSSESRLATDQPHKLACLPGRERQWSQQRSVDPGTCFGWQRASSRIAPTKFTRCWPNAGSVGCPFSPHHASKAGKSPRVGLLRASGVGGPRVVARRLDEGRAGRTSGWGAE